MPIKINIDASQISSAFAEFKTEVEQDIQKGVAGLAAMTHAKVIDLASQELNTTRKKLIDNLEVEEVSPGLWVVSIDQEALFIEDGIPENTDMKPGLLKNATKTSKAGFKYRSIPFEHSKPSSQQYGYSKMLTDKIKYNLKKLNVPYKKIEKNPDGSPRLGKLHTFNFGGGKPTPRASHEALQGVSIYQSLTKTGNVRRDILTFRTVSAGPASEGKWIHPGLKPKHFLEKAAEWAEKEFYEHILPEILSKY